MSVLTRSLAVGASAVVGLALAVTGAPSAAGAPVALAPLSAPSGAQLIPNQYIVMLKPGMSTSSVGAAASRAQANGVEVTHRFGALGGYVATMTADQAQALRRDSSVALIEQDQVMKATAETWGLDRTDQRNLPLDGVFNPGATGEGTTSYIIDTGIQTSHSEFTGRTRAGYTAINDGNGTNDCQGHGTHVAGTVGGTTYGMAKKTTLVPVRVLGCNGSGANSGVIAGMDWVAQNASGPSVANMSLGGGVSTATDDAVNRMVARNVTVVVAAGNDDVNACNGSPARAPAAITVGATGRTDARVSNSLWGSNYGSCVDLFAPGEGITSAWIGSNTATNTISGTSMATPHVAGAAALYLGNNRSATPAQVTSAILNASTPNKVTNPGTGSPNRLLYAVFGGTTPPPTTDPTPPPTTDPTPPPTGECASTATGSVRAGTAVVGTSYTVTGSGLHTGCLTGPSGTDFDLYLQKQSSTGTWRTVAYSTGYTSTEKVRYNGTAGSYRWVVDAYSGSGTFTLKYSRP